MSTMRAYFVTAALVAAVVFGAFSGPHGWIWPVLVLVLASLSTRDN